MKPKALDCCEHRSSRRRPDRERRVFEVERDLRARFGGRKKSRDRRRSSSAHRDGSPYLGDADTLLQASERESPFPPSRPFACLAGRFPDSRFTFRVPRFALRVLRVSAVIERKSRPEAAIHLLRHHELRITNCKSRITHYGLRITSPKPRTPNPFVTVSWA